MHAYACSCRKLPGICGVPCSSLGVSSNAQQFLTACKCLQLESIAGFGAVIDRLGQFTEVTAELQPETHRRAYWHQFTI